MAYSTFTLDKVALDFGVRVREVPLFHDRGSVAAPAWLVDSLARYNPLAFISEKSRNEFIVAPILVACRELLDNQVFLYSGIRLDADIAQGLQGECDFLFAHTPPTPVLEAPLLMVVEAKKNDMEWGQGQCAAQLVAARLYNEKRKRSLPTVFGCVTTGEAWQFMKLEGTDLLIHHDRFYINDLDQVLWSITKVLKAGVAQAREIAA